MWDLDELVKITGARVLRRPRSGQVRPVPSGDEIRAGDLLFPLRPTDLADSLYEALTAAGAAGVVLFGGQEPPDPQRFPDLGVLQMPRPVVGYNRLGAAARQRSQALVIGVTGTSGKSSTKEFLAHLLRGRYAAVHSTYNSRNTTASCTKLLLGMDGTAREAAVIEMGFDHVGDIDMMAAMAQPFAGIITKVTPAHLTGVGGALEVVAREKGKLGLHVPPHGFMILNADDPGSRLIPASRYNCRVYTFGAGPHADAWYETVRVTEEGTRFTLHLGDKPLMCRLKASAAHQAANATAAALAALLLGMSPAEIADRLSEVEPLPRRFRLHRYTQSLTIIDDTFNSNFDAACRGLESAARLAGNRRRVAVMSSLARLEHHSAEIHRQLGLQVAACGFGTLVLVGDEADLEYLRDGALEGGLSSGRIHMVREKAGLTESLMPLVRSDTLVYIKARMFAKLGPEVDRFRKAVAGAGFRPYR